VFLLAEGTLCPTFYANSVSGGRIAFARAGARQSVGKQGVLCGNG